MRLIVPTASRGLQEDTVRSLIDAGADFEIVFLEDDPGAYTRLFVEMWSAGESWINVEHDMLIHDDVVPQFEKCPELWCGFSYTVGDPPYRLAALGCTRFRAELMAREPGLMHVVAADGTGGLPAGDWRRMDVRIQGELQTRGYTRCEAHLPDVKHLHRYREEAV